jgi:hypothetical protein
MAEDIGAEFDVPSIIRGLNQDLLDLRAGTITPNEAKVRADIAKQIFNGLRMVVTAQRFLSERARKLNEIGSRDDQPEETKPWAAG